MFHMCSNELTNYLDDESGQLMAHVQLEGMPTSLAAGPEDASLGLHVDDGLWIVALSAENEPGEQRRQ